jgi:hypothetical protein
MYAHKRLIMAVLFIILAQQVMAYYNIYPDRDTANDFTSYAQGQGVGALKNITIDRVYVNNAVTAVTGVAQ